MGLSAGLPLPPPCHSCAAARPSLAALKFSITDLFVVGLGFDIAGAGLLARGLLISHEQIKKFGTWAGLGHAQVVDRARNRVDAQFGISLLLAGFILQFAGYALELSGTSPHTGTARLVTAMVLGVAAVGVSLLTWRLLREPMLRRTLVRTARAPDPADEPKHSVARGMRLVEYGQAAGYPMRPDESDEHYAERVFGVKPDPPVPGGPIASS